MQNYASNSDLSKENPIKTNPRKPQKKVIKGSAKQNKGGEFKRAVDDNVRELKNYVLKDVLLPAIKRTISDIVGNGVSILLGEKPSARQSNIPATRVSYRAYYDERNSEREAPKPRTVYQYSDICLDSSSDAESVYERMQEILSQYQVVSVGDLYELVDIQTNFTDYKYGWTSMKNAYIAHTSRGYELRMPRPMAL